MASNTSKRIALLSIRPQYVNLIIEGRKKVEFRKVRFHNKLLHVVMYTSKPVQKVLGYFDVSYVDEDSPKELWARYNTVGGILKREFDAYYASSGRGVAIGIGKVCALQNPISLRTLGKLLTPPQSFTYLNTEIFQVIQGCRKTSR